MKFRLNARRRSSITSGTAVNSSSSGKFTVSLADSPLFTRASNFSTSGICTSMSSKYSVSSSMRARSEPRGIEIWMSMYDRWTPLPPPKSRPRGTFLLNTYQVAAKQRSPTTTVDHGKRSVYASSPE